MNKSHNTSPHLSKSLLTPNGLSSLIDQNHKGITIQLISPELLPDKQPSANSLKYKVVISDGSAKHKAVLGNKAALTFRTAGAPNFAIVTVWDIMQINSNPAKKLIILTDIEIVNTSQKSPIGYPIDYQEWQQQVQQYENIQKNNQSNSKPFAFEDNTNNNLSPPPIMEEVLPRTISYENNSFSLQEYKFSRNDSRPSKGTNSIPKQESKPISQERIVFPTNNYSMEAENKNKNNIKSLNPQSNQSSDVSPAKNKLKPSPTLHNSLTTATETDSDVSIEIEKPKPTALKTQNSVPQTKTEKEDIACQRNIKKLIQFPVYGMNVRPLEDQDSHEFHQAIGMDQAFSADFVDKNGNKITAVFFGEQAENFLSSFRDHDTHIISNLTGKMSIEK